MKSTTGKELKFIYDTDFWGYTDDPKDNHYYFESRLGDMLIGDRLPPLTEGYKEALAILRAANKAHRIAIEHLQLNLNQWLKTFLRTRGL